MILTWNVEAIAGSPSPRPHPQLSAVELCSVHELWSQRLSVWQFIYFIAAARHQLIFIWLAGGGWTTNQAQTTYIHSMRELGWIYADAGGWLVVSDGWGECSYLWTDWTARVVLSCLSVSVRMSPAIHPLCRVVLQGYVIKKLVLLRSSTRSSP